MILRCIKMGLVALMTLAFTVPAASLATVSAAQGFKDTNRHWGALAIEWAAGQGIVDGYEDGTFRPDNIVSEPEFLAMLLRAYPSPIGSAEIGQAWYEPYYVFAASRHWSLLNNPDRNRYNRGYVARLIASTQQGTLDLNASVQYLLDAGLSQGKTAATVEGYRAAEPLSRAEAVQFIMNLRSKVTELKAAQASAVKDEAREASVSVRGIAIGDTAGQVTAKLGQPARQDASEYGFTWYVYNQDYSNYIQVGIAGGKVLALYSPSDNWHTDLGIQDGAAQSTVHKQYGSPLTYILKGNTRFMLNNAKGEYDTYDIDGAYVTFFYDVHRNDIVTGVQVIGQATEQAMAAFYAGKSAALVQAFERQSFDLANAARAKLGYDAFVWSDAASATARKHSQDMADRGYFDHTNRSGLSPFDRMENDGIAYRAAAENIAAGQTSAIFAHHGWMNSEGHRKNLLSDIKRLGVGVAFGGPMNIYYTQNFFTP
ncbi:CAP-associated domain-containing protein [Paenibacillus sp.]|uniref:CAP-associated domain-containing protein n=1 Tax=Paenibacillus sp. TaxID=58172 RepID=UPI00356B3584